MWIVRLALRRPYTFAVLALLIAILGGLTIVRTPTDIFPEINIPVVSVLWVYNGLSAQEMEGRMVTISERAMTTTVNDIEHIESQSLNGAGIGAGVIRVFFQPNASIDAAVAQTTAINQTILRVLPPGTTPPFILQYSATNVPIMQLALQSPTLSEQQLYDYGLNFIRTQLATVQGAQVPLPWGGKTRQIMVDLDPNALYAKGLSPIDISNAVNTQNVILPAGTAKMGPIEYVVRTNSSPDAFTSLNDVPVRQDRQATVFLSDVAQVHDGFPPQTSMVHVDGRRSAMLSVLKTANASTLDIVQRVRAALPRIQTTLPADLEVTPLFDQSVFVRAALNGVLREALIAAALTGLMILLFLGSWRSTLVILVSIPLAILVSVIVFSLMGQTLNTMTLGGLALAVGILSTMRRWRSRTPTAISAWGNPSPVPSSTARSRSRCPRSSPRSASASSSCRSSSSPASPATSSHPWRSPSCWPCWPATSCRAPWSRRWCSTCCRPKRTSTSQGTR